MSGRIFITGDCHADFRRFSMSNFPEQKTLDKDDYVIVCGDFGLIWDMGEESKEERYWLKWFEDKPYTTLFVDGNHENFDRLYEYPVAEWHGGKVHKLRPSVFHLIRGQVFDISEKTFFTFGGASSLDADGGILHMEDPNYHDIKKRLDRDYIMYRVEHKSWWKEELPSEEEVAAGLETLQKAGNKVDVIITHCCATELQEEITKGRNYKPDRLTDFLSDIRRMCSYDKWFFGHYHADEWINERERLVYRDIVEL